MISWKCQQGSECELHMVMMNIYEYQNFITLQMQAPINMLTFYELFANYSIHIGDEAISQKYFHFYCRLTNNNDNNNCYQFGHFDDTK